MDDPTLEVLTPKQLAEWIGRSEGTLANDRYLRRGFPFTRVGRKIYYFRRDVLRFLEENRIDPSE